MTLTGRDHPGIASRLTGLLADAGAVLLDIEQVVVRGQLTLCLLVRVPEGRGVLQALHSTAQELGVSLGSRAVGEPAPRPSRPPVVMSSPWWAVPLARASCTR
ncbi:ACT domain-containing protein [Cystobacter fuscus]